ncbi:hypothetical protein C8F01DRAFT_1311218 [Mycena amicta]|nr:hypothetical protein C8F01DRAFT_1311218 [Mycena amicta]
MSRAVTTVILYHQRQVNVHRVLYDLELLPVPEESPSSRISSPSQDATTTSSIKPSSKAASYPPTSLPIVKETFNNLLINSSCASAINATAEAKQLPAVGVPGLLFDGDIDNVTSAFGTFRAGNWVKVPLLVNTDEGPTFAIPGANATNEARSAMSPLIADPTQLDQLFELYPDIPALGSPFNTGDF